MPRTPDRFPGSREEEEIIVEDTGQDPADAGGVRYNGGVFKLRDAIGVFDPRTGGSGISEAAHKTLRQLIHFIDNGPAEGFASGAYREVTGTVFPSAVIWYDDNTKAKKIVEKNITYTGSFPTTIEWKVYDADGSTVLATVTDVITLSGPFETSRTRTIA